MERALSTLLLATLLCAMFAATACDGTTPTVSDDPIVDADAGDAAIDPACDAVGNGTLDVTISGLPEGLLGSVSVDNASPPLSASGIVSVSGGYHTVTADVVTQAGSIVRRAYDATIDVDTPCVKSDQATKVNVVYSLIPTSDKLWATHANGTGDFAGFPSASLAASGTATPTIVSDGLIKTSAVAFDQSGNAWVADNASVKRFAANQFTGASPAVSDVELTADAFTAGSPGPSGIAFDKEGNLWVSVVAAKKIVKFALSPESGGFDTPTQAIEGAALDGVGPIAFDASGNLYAGTAANVVRYNAARLTTSTADAPDLVLEAKTPEPTVVPLGAPTGLAFEADGGLWVGYFGGNTLAHFTAAELSATATASLTPAIQIVVDVTALLEGIAFDEGKGLWLTYKTGQVARFSPTQLTASSSAVPETIVTGTNVGSTASVTFFPAPVGLPLFSAIP